MTLQCGVCGTEKSPHHPEATPQEFRTAWFIESLMTELVITFVIRTQRPFYRSRPGRLLLWTTLAVMAVTLLLPYLPLAGYFEFTPLAAPVMAIVLLITLLYAGATEVAKHVFHARLSSTNRPGRIGRRRKRPATR
jgi:Mg2+-importing ATPase